MVQWAVVGAKTVTVKMYRWLKNQNHVLHLEPGVTLPLSACIFSFQLHQDEHTEVAIVKGILAPLASAE